MCANSWLIVLATYGPRQTRDGETVKHVPFAVDGLVTVRRFVPDPVSGRGIPRVTGNHRADVGFL